MIVRCQGMKKYLRLMDRMLFYVLDQGDDDMRVMLPDFLLISH
jgi:hypothetical protein